MGGLEHIHIADLFGKHGLGLLLVVAGEGAP
jgi:hypothetical protein